MIICSLLIILLYLNEYNKMKIYIKLQKSNRKNKKYMMNFYIKEDAQVKKFLTTHFGDNRFEDYTIHKDENRKNLYLVRHMKNERWGNFWTAGSLSRFILWNKKTIDESLKDYANKFDLIII